ncbi:hypothetical protein [Streptomyces sp. NPDC048644]|uniref:caspase, EACC1-associated type n=1 Tax=Streptomyces sp. NPDC048644 TaxID=3365582 RepID=UPI00371BFA72
MPSDSWPPLVPVAARSAAVLIGTATAVVPGSLPPLPQAAASVTALAAQLTGPLGAFDPSAVHRRVDPQTPADVLRLLPAPGRAPLDVLLFFYAGHGLLGEDKRLCLALPGSVDDGPVVERTSLPVAAVFQAMRQVRAEHKVAVLDCCFAGRALDAAGAADIHLLTAAGRTKKALTPEGHEHTGFTAALLRLAADGIPDGPDHLDLGTLYRHLAVTLPAAGLPEPLQRAFGTTGDLALFRNSAHGTAHTRPGLRARARFAAQVRALGRRGRPGRAAQAARLFAALAGDAAAALGPAHHDSLRYRHAHASTTGEAGDPDAACALLEGIVAEGTPEAGAQGPAAARASLEFWRREAAGRPGPDVPSP